MQNNLKYDMVVSLEDLLGRLLVASERQIAEYNNPDDGVIMLGLPFPADATNEQLDQLRPLYIKLLRNAEDPKAEDCVLNRLDESEDQAILLLYVLEFPLLVINVRGDISGIARCHSTEQFKLTDIVRKIMTNSTLLSWCRKAISKEGRPKTSSLIKSAVSILQHVSDEAGILSESKAKKLVRKHIFGGVDDTQGFRDLRDDLVDVLVHVQDGDPHPQLVVNSILLQMHALRTSHGMDRAIELLANAPNRAVFEEALYRVREDLEEGILQSFRMMLGCPTTRMELLATTQVKRINRDANKPVYVCGNDGCSKLTSQRCDQCKLVGYCSRECQVQDWKAGHKKVCKKKTKPIKERKVMASAEAARKQMSPALMKQENLLKMYPNCSYAIVLPSGKIDIGIELIEPMIKISFDIARSKAPTSPRCVCRMSEILAQAHPMQKEVIRKQLLAEYGVDPESDLARNGPEVKVTEDDVLRMFKSL